MMVKDFKTVADYNNQRKMDIFKGLCLKIAGCIVPDLHSKNYSFEKIATMVFNLSEDLYEEGIKRNYPNLELKSEGE